MTHPLPALASLLLAAPLVAPLASAQAPPPSPVVEHRSHALPWPMGPVQDPTYDRAVAGQLTDDLVPDAVLLVDDVPVLLSGPAQYGASISLPTVANDLAVLDVVGDSDVLATAGVSALELWRIDVPTATAVPVGGAAMYADARAVRAADVDRDGQEDLVVLSASGSRIDVVRVSGSGPYSLATQAAFSFQPGDELAVTLETVDWDGTGPLEIAVLTPNRLRVHRLDGATLFDVSSVFHSTPMSMAVVDSATDPRQRVAWVTIGIFNTPWILLVGEDGLEGPFDLGTFDASPPTAADYDGDGDSELFFAPDQADHLFMLTSFSELGPAGHPTYDVTTHGGLRFPLGAAPSSYVDRADRPLVHDFDNDGDPDVLIVDEAREEIRLLRGDAELEVPRMFLLEDGELVEDCTGGFGSLQLTLISPAAVPQDVDRVEVVVWEQATPSDEIDELPVETLTFPISSTPPPTISLALTIPQVGLEFDARYYVQVRMVSVSAAGAERGWPAFPLAVGITEGSQLGLETDPALGLELGLDLVACPCATCGTATRGGSGAPLPVIQPYRDDRLPGDT